MRKEVETGLEWLGGGQEGTHRLGGNSLSAKSCWRKPRISRKLIGGALAVGSRAGAMFRRSSLAVSPRFLWECLISQTVNPFPAPATSHPACGFPALGAPVCFVTRVMWPIVLE
jgi:hypothetical protein